MTLIHAECERMIGAPAGTVFAFLADYRDHHPHIQPTDTFFDVTVLEGDIGASVLVAYRFLAGGRARSYRLRVSEPEPGMTLVERDELSTMVMTYTVTQTTTARPATSRSPASGTAQAASRASWSACSLLLRYERSSSGSWPSSTRR